MLFKRTFLRYMYYIYMDGPSPHLHQIVIKVQQGGHSSYEYKQSFYYF